ncbi:PAS domain S-box protein, partial [bacterium]|nr:PAS domain S-box protein [bacterium]
MNSSRGTPSYEELEQRCRQAEEKLAELSSSGAGRSPSQNDPYEDQSHIRPDETQWYRSLLDNAAVGIGCWDENGSCLLMNRIACEHMQMEPESVIGRHASDLFGNEMGALMMDRIAKTFASDAPITFEDVVDLPAGKRCFLSTYAVIPGTAVHTGSVQIISHDITAHKSLEHDLRESEERFRAFFEHTAVGLGIIDDQCRYVVANEALARINGLSVEEHAGKAIEDMFPDLAPMMTGHIKEVIDTGKPKLGIQGCDPNMQGETVHWITTIFPLSMDKTKDRTTGIVVIDITEQKQVEEKLRDALETFSKVFHRAPIMMAISDLEDGTYHDVNQAFLDTSGFLREDVIGKRATDFGIITPDERSKLMTEFESKGRVENLELMLAHKDGTPLLILYSGELMEIGGTRRLLSLGIDITEKKRAEQALQESEERYRAVFENSAIGIGIRTPDNVYVDFNTYYTEMLGYSTEELKGLKTEDITHPEDVPVSKENLAVVAEGRAKFRHYQKRYLRKDGTPVWGEVAIRGLKDANGKVTAIVGVVNNINTRKLAEQALLESEERLRTLINATPDIICFKDGEGRWLEANDADLELFQITGVDYRGKTDKELAEYSEFYREAFLTCEDTDEAAWQIGGLSRGEEAIPRPDGSSKIYDVIKMPLFYEDGRRKGLVVLGRDVTERRMAEKERARLEEELQQAQKLESIGRLAGGVAHDFNNNLSVILGNVEMAMMDLPPDEPLYTDLKEIETTALRSADLTRQLLGFARRQTVTPKVLSPNDTIEGQLKMLRRVIGENIELHWKPADKAGMVRIDPSQMDQILTNLVVNARDAVGDFGTISISTGEALLAEEETRDHPDSEPGVYVRIRVRDNGQGMDSDTLQQIFDPFFTTKPRGEGTGLGLSTVYGIVKQNDGSIHVDSSPGQGSTFDIYLPRYTAREKATSVSSGQAPPLEGRGTVLFVEDESSLLRLGRRILEKAG